MSHPTSGDSKIGDIQVLRGIAVATVVFQHLHFSTHLFRQFTHAVTPPSWLAVDLFFVISGFVITGALFRDHFDLFSFLIKRAFRLLPAAIVFILLCLALNAYFLHRWQTRGDLPELTRLMYVVNWPPMGQMSLAILGGFYTLQRHGCALYGGMWSLSVEDQFYLSLALVCLGAVLTGRQRAARMLPRLVAGAAIGLYLFGVAWRAKIALSGQGMDTLPRIIRYFLFHRFDLLALGVTLAFLNRRWGGRFERFFRTRGAFLAPLLLLSPFALVALTGPSYTPQTMSVGILGTGLGFGLLTLAAAHGHAFPKPAGHLYRAFCWLGDRSYTIYLFHFAGMALAWIVTDALFPKYAGEKVHATTVVLQLILVPMLTWPLVELVYRGVEKPLTERGRSFAQRLRRRPVESSAVSAAPSGDGVLIPTRPRALRQAA